MMFHIEWVCYLHEDVIKWKHFPCNWPLVRGIHRSPVNSPHEGQWRGALMFVCFFYLRLNKRLSKQSWGWWFETPSRPLWRHRNETYRVISSSHLHRGLSKIVALLEKFRLWMQSQTGIFSNASMDRISVNIFWYRPENIHLVQTTVLTLDVNKRRQVIILSRDKFNLKVCLCLMFSSMASFTNMD